MHKNLSFLLLAGLFIGQIGQSLAQDWFKPAWPNTDFSRHVIDFSEILSGGVPKDGIPAIDRPSFESVDQASQWMSPDEPVIVLRVSTKARAYPLQILTWHEIVNDSLEDVPVAVTYCPLCNAAIVFNRRVNGQVLDFGTTGLLRNSDLVMYDRQSESWWQQFSGRGIVGQYTGTLLATLPAQVVAFREFADAFPEGTVLSKNTGMSRAYGRNPYTGYDRIGERPFLFRGKLDERLPAMERVLNVSIEGQHKIYPLSELESRPVVNDNVAGLPVLVLAASRMRSALDRASIADSRFIPAAVAYARQAGERLLSFETDGGEVVDRETGSRWNVFGEAVSGPLKGQQLEALGGGAHFAFAWLAFFPQSEIFRAGK